MVLFQDVIQVRHRPVPTFFVQSAFSFESVFKKSYAWTCCRQHGPVADHVKSTFARRQAGRAACPSVVIMDGQSVKTTERGGIRGFDAHKRVKGRKRHILVDTLGLADRMQSGASRHLRPKGG